MKKILGMLLALAAWPTFASADMSTNMQLQSYLNALGYDVGVVDGLIGKNTKRRLIEALSDNGYDFDGSVDESDVETLRRIAKKKRVKLPERMLGASRKNLQKIMDKQTAKLFVESGMNPKRYFERL